jgi:hypothetical protein
VGGEKRPLIAKHSQEKSQIALYLTQTYYPSAWGATV